MRYAPAEILARNLDSEELMTAYFRVWGTAVPRFASLVFAQGILAAAANAEGESKNGTGIVGLAIPLALTFCP